MVFNEQTSKQTAWAISLALHGLLLALTIPALSLKNQPQISQIRLPVNLNYIQPATPVKTVAKKPKKRTITKTKATSKKATPKRITKQPQPKQTQTKTPTPKATPPAPATSQAPAATAPPKPTSLPGDRPNAITSTTPAPIYPKSAINNSWGGTIILKVTINPEGTPIYTNIVQSSGHTILDQSFIRTVMTQYTYKPKRKMGENEQDIITLKYTFNPE